MNMNKEGPPDLDELLKNLLGSFTRNNSSKNNNENNESNGSSFSRMPINTNFVYIGLIVVAVLWFVLGFYIVNEKERAVVLRLGKFSDTLLPGLHWKPYIIDRVEKVNVTSVRVMNTTGTMLTKDENIIKANISLQYIINSPKDFLLNVKEPELGLANALDSAIRHEVGGATMNSVLTTGRGDLATNVDTRLKGYMQLYASGIEIVKVNIESTQAPSEVQEAFDDVIKAREDETRYINQAITYSNELLPKAKGMAERVKKEADAYNESVVAIATGEADRFDSLVVEYKRNPSITRDRLYNDTIERILGSTTKIMVDTNARTTFLPLMDLMKINNEEVAKAPLYEPSSTQTQPSSAQPNIR